MEPPLLSFGLPRGPRYWGESKGGNPFSRRALCPAGPAQERHYYAKATLSAREPCLTPLARACRPPLPLRSSGSLRVCPSRGSPQKLHCSRKSGSRCRGRVSPSRRRGWPQPNCMGGACALMHHKVPASSRRRRRACRPYRASQSSFLPQRRFLPLSSPAFASQRRFAAELSQAKPNPRHPPSLPQRRQSSPLETPRLA